MTSKLKHRAKSKQSEDVIDVLKKQTHFSKNEIEKLYGYFKKITTTAEFESHSGTLVGSSSQTSKREGIDRIMFREILHNTFRVLSEDVIMDRIFNAFDKRSDGVIQVDEWISGLSVFLRGTLEEQIAFSFFVYDLNSDGVISKEEIHALLRNSLLKLPNEEDPEDSVRDLVEITLKKLDADRDNKVSFQDFRETVQKENLLLEALGQCLPTEDVREAFLCSLTKS